MSDPHNCPAIRSQLPLYVGEDLDGHDQEVVRRHLEACAPCRWEAERAERAREAYRAGSDAAEALLSERPVHLWPGVRQALLAEGLLNHPAPEPESSTRRPGGLRRPHVLRLVSGLAAAAVLLFLARPLWLDGSGSPETRETFGERGTSGEAGAPPAVMTAEAGLPSEPIPLPAFDAVGLDQAALAASVDESPRGGLRPVRFGEEERLYDQTIEGPVFAPAPAGANVAVSNRSLQ